MAKYERNLYGNFDEVLHLCDTTIQKNSVSASLEDGSDFLVGNTRVAVRIYERYSYIGKNRVSLSLTVVGTGDRVLLSAITSGGSQAMFFKINTMGESAFLDTLIPAIESAYPR